MIRLLWSLEFLKDLANIPEPAKGFSDALVNNMEHLFQLMDIVNLSSDLCLAIPWLLWGI